KVVRRSAAYVVVERIAKPRRGKKLGEGPRASGAPIEYIGCNRPEAEPIARPGGNHEAVERREHLGLIGDVALEAEFDATAHACGNKVADVALEARLARGHLLEH